MFKSGAFARRDEAMSARLPDKKGQLPLAPTASGSKFFMSILNLTHIKSWGKRVGAIDAPEERSPRGAAPTSQATRAELARQLDYPAKAHEI
ncbi:hypothetical protein [Bradyrhizobium yuanmingense]|uniref:hypothetical protein n=1 Tax=Bradyrhizobium yuanmingense TaxID=108015 RepID=UPI0023BA2D76|nr:hypothetical protein [Bradyrhizobium yuanmingense]MDF0498859.1 hypothetical protein [Bradyrhizobium yuanmingense]